MFSYKIDFFYSLKLFISTLGKDTKHITIKIMNIIHKHILLCNNNYYLIRHKILNSKIVIIMNYYTG